MNSVFPSFPFLLLLHIFQHSLFSSINITLGSRNPSWIYRLIPQSSYLACLEVHSFSFLFSLYISLVLSFYIFLWHTFLHHINLLTELYYRDYLGLNNLHIFFLKVSHFLQLFTFTFLSFIWIFLWFHFCCKLLLKELLLEWKLRSESVYQKMKRVNVYKVKRRNV